MERVDQQPTPGLEAERAVLGAMLIDESIVSQVRRHQKGGCEVLPFPDKKYSIIYADPPWSYSDSGCSGAAAAQYATMSINELKQLPVNPAGGGIAADDCVLFMWATYPMIQEALDLIEAWGFKYKSIAFQWIKQNRSGNGYFFGLGHWTRGNTEPCLIAIKGKPKRISSGVGQLVFSPLRRHSQKPAEVRDKIVELMGDLPRIELFAREAAPGWDVWGNEAPPQSENGAWTWNE